jgi:hypothetical protein
MKKSSIGGNRYLVYLWELAELPVYIYWWCWRFAAPDSLRSVHSENQGFFNHVLPLMSTKLLEFCQKSGLLPGNNSW